MGFFDPAIFNPLMEGLKTTMYLDIITLVVSIPAGLLIAIVHRYAPKLIKLLIEGYVYIFRGTPMLLQLMFTFFGLPFIGIVMDRMDAAALTIILNYAAYFVEIFRGGLNAIPDKQYEALQVLSISRFQGLKNVIVPQMWRIVLPSVGNEVISLSKDTALIYILGIDELLKTGRALANQQASLMPFVYVGVIYLIITAITTYILKRVEDRIMD